MKVWKDAFFRETQERGKLNQSRVCDDAQQDGQALSGGLAGGRGGKKHN